MQVHGTISSFAMLADEVVVIRDRNEVMLWPL